MIPQGTAGRREEQLPLGPRGRLERIEPQRERFVGQANALRLRLRSQENPGRASALEGDR